MNEFDIIIIGAGPGGYHAANYAAEHGKTVLLVEKEAIGGTCLNWGCIPTKTLLNLAKQCSYSKELKDMGIESTVSYSQEKAMLWKAKVVAVLQQGVAGLLKKNKVTIVEGLATIKTVTADKKIVSVTVNDVEKGKEEEYKSEYVIIAGGVESVIPPIEDIAKANPLTSKEILNIDYIPKDLVIIGGGVIGIEFAAVFAQLGADEKSQVTVIEALSDILPQTEPDSVKIIKKVLSEEYGVKFICGAKVVSMKEKSLVYEQDEKKDEVSFDTLLVSTGRKTDLSQFSTLGINTSKMGIEVNETMETNIPNLYAIGDVVGHYQLAHIAYRQAEVAIDAILGHKKPIRYIAVPSVVYTNPEIASCGLTEAQAKEQGYEVVSTALPIVVSGRAIAEHGPNSKGQCKMVADKQTGKVLGIHMVGPMVSEIIAVAAIILEVELRVQELVEIIFPHPTVAEIIHNVSLVLINKINK